MNTSLRIVNSFGLALILLALTASGLRPAKAQNNAHDPTMVEQYEFILNQGSDGDAGPTASVSFGSTWMSPMSCGRRASFITLIPTNPKRLPPDRMKSFAYQCAVITVPTRNELGGVDLPLPPPKSKSGLTLDRPTLAF